jgi:glutamate racemase
LGCQVINRGTDVLVPFIEKGEINSKEFSFLLEFELKPFKDAQIDTLALGCSHFPFIKDQIQQILGPGVTILDSGGAIARQVHRVLLANNSLASESATYQFYTTGAVTQFNTVASALLKRHIQAEMVGI